MFSSETYDCLNISSFCKIRNFNEKVSQDLYALDSPNVLQHLYRLNTTHDSYDYIDACIETQVVSVLMKPVHVS